MHQVEYDPRADRLTIRVSGPWSPQDVPGLAADVGVKANEARAAGGSFDVLVESLEFPVQTNEVADLLPHIMDAGMSLTTGHAAVVVGSHLNKLQAERTLLHPRLKVFLSLDEAEAWLAAPD